MYNTHSEGSESHTGRLPMLHPSLPTQYTQIHQTMRLSGQLTHNQGCATAATQARPATAAWGMQARPYTTSKGQYTAAVGCSTAGAAAAAAAASQQSGLPHKTPSRQQHSTAAVQYYCTAVELGHLAGSIAARLHCCTAWAIILPYSPAGPSGLDGDCSQACPCAAEWGGAAPLPRQGVIALHHGAGL